MNRQILAALTVVAQQNITLTDTITITYILTYQGGS